ncbi:MAG: hypothetical protein ACQERJ_07450 [Bacillota bacterium]
MMEGVIVKKSFDSFAGVHIEEGEFWFDEQATNQLEGEGRIYLKAGYDTTIKLTKQDLGREEVEEIEIHWR